MHWYQLLVIIFGLSMAYLTFLDYKRKVLKSFEWLFFSLVWLTGITLALFPESTQIAPRAFRVARILDLVTVTGIIILSFLVYVMYVKTKKTEKKLEDLTRKDALKDLLKKSKRLK